MTFEELLKRLSKDCRAKAAMLGVLPKDKIKKIDLDFSGGNLRGGISVDREDGWVIIHNKVDIGGW